MTARMTARERSLAIAERDDVFATLIDVVGPAPGRRAMSVAQRFPTLARAITFQLLATKAATTIHQRVIEHCDGVVTPEAVTRVGYDGLRALGLSTVKAQAMIDLAQRTLDGRIRLTRHGRMSDRDVLADLVAVRGVGPWTAQMYLMQTLGRHDVWPTGDFGVRHGWSLLHGVAPVITQKDLQAAGATFTGFRSDVAWYCWRAVDLARAR